MDFSHIPNITSEQRVRAWAVEQSIESIGDGSHASSVSETITRRAGLIENFVMNSAEYHDDQTLGKVRDAINSVSGTDGQITNDIISELQNQGILFRERK